MYRFSKLAVLLIILGACRYGFSAAVTIPAPQTYVPYTVNLMWINAQYNSEQPYIWHSNKFSSETLLQGLYDNFLEPIFAWARVSSPKSIIQVWYDSQMTPEHAVENTRDIIDREQANNPEWAHIILKDIRQLPIIKENPDVFSSEMPLFFRFDLAKVIAAVHEVEAGNTPYYVHTDLDTAPESESQLFDTQTMEDLKEWGTVMGGDPKSHLPTRPMENSFFILSRYKSNILKALHFALIDLNIWRAKKSYDLSPELLFKRLNEKVYYSYPDMFKYFLALEGHGQLYLDIFPEQLILTDDQIQELKKIDLQDLTFELFEMKLVDTPWGGKWLRSSLRLIDERGDEIANGITFLFPPTKSVKGPESMQGTDWEHTILHKQL